MTEYDNTNRGAIWKNDKRETDKHPHFTGSINVDGTDYWLKGWKSDGSNPRAPLVSFSVKSKDSQRAPNPAPPQADNDFDDPIPF